MNFTAGAATGVTALQFTAGLPSGWNLVSVSTGSVAPGASKLTADNPSNSIVILFGFNQTPIPSGVVALLQINIPSSAASGNYPLTINNVIFSGANGNVVPGSSSNGSIVLHGASGTSMFVDLHSVRVYPNPWRSDKDSGQPIKFDQLSPGSRVKIFTLSGREVISLDGSSGAVSWNRANSSGDSMTSGIYLYLITDGQGNQVKGKFMIIR